MNEDYIAIDLKELNSVCKKKPVLYDQLSQLYYLPDINSKACTDEYL